MNCPFTTVLEDDDVTCDSKSREDNGLNLNSIENAVTFDAIHSSCLGKDYSFFHVLSAAVTTT